MRTLVLIPAFNEAEALPGLIEELRAVIPDLPVLVVDDASVDGSGELLPSLMVRRVQLAQHLGLGGAIRAGLRYARTLGFDCVVRIDADGQHPPSHIPDMLEPITSERADATVGSRYLGSGGYRPGGIRRLVQIILSGSLGNITGRAVTDPTSGFWGFGPRVLNLLADHHPRGYSEPELHLFLHRNSMVVQEISVEMRDRQGGRSSLSLPRAGMAITRALLAMVVVPRRSRVGR